MKRNKEITKIEIEYVCDLCERPFSRAASIKACQGCGIELCKDKCAIFWFNDPFTGEDNGDYPPIGCEECTNSALKVGLESRDILEEAYDTVEAIKKAWKKESWKRRNG